MQWIYDPGEKRYKHKWSKDYAGFETEGNVRVGKCPKSLTPDVATELINSGVEWNNPYLPGDYPQHIYNVHDGVVYKGATTLRGVSYHGFPYEGRVPKEVIVKLRDLAAAKNCTEKFEAWLKQHIQ